MRASVLGFVVFTGLAIALAGCQTSKTGDACGCGGCSASACGCGACGACGKAACGCEAGANGCGKGACGCGEGGCGGCGGGGCGCGAGASMAASDQNAATRLIREYTGWHKETAKPFRSKGHNNMQVDVFVNAIAARTFRSGQGDYPPGAAIAKTGSKGGAMKMIFLMEKRAAGYDRDNGDWFYAGVAADGTVKTAGKLGACAACHSADPANDYVFGATK
ncbi:MAG: cytochrome P460 family protein [Planctomycetota bacterium]